MLWASGWTLDNVLDLSWEQLSTVVACVLSYKVEQANIVSDAVTAALGGKVERRGTTRPRRNKAKQQRTDERALLAQFAQHGFTV